MHDDANQIAAGSAKSLRLFVYNGGFLTQKRVRRILELSGYSIQLGQPKDGDLVGVWGKSPTSGRGEKVAQKADALIVRAEDAFLRSVLPGRTGSAPIGLHLDHSGVHFDSSQPSDLETILATDPLDDQAILNRARGAMAQLQELHLSKYCAFDPNTLAPTPGYVLVIDQTRGDASVKYSGANSNTFLEMLYYAQEENPNQRVIIKTHPETEMGLREGYFDESHCNDRVSLFSDPISPWVLLEGATAVYVVSSQLGFEAIQMGHRPRVFGQPFYAGWGLTEDEFPITRRQRKLTRVQLFAASMILYPKWYDPHRDRLCSLEDAILALAAETRAWREDQKGYVASGMRLWKRKPLQAFYGKQRKLRFEDDPQRAEAIAREDHRSQLVWAGKAHGHEGPHLNIEDGFLRSKGLGAQLIPPLSLVADDLGIYYNPQSPSRLETMIKHRKNLRPDQVLRIETLIRNLCAAKLSKYNLAGSPLPILPDGHRILVPGQVEDDASIKTGCGDICTNLGLLKSARAANPEAVILYKPHPDVEAGLRVGAITETDALAYADQVLAQADPIALLDHVQEVWTLTSLLGFEALLRGCAVTCLGSPFYAGWGLTSDKAPRPERRDQNVSINSLAYACLIDYPRYHDPVTNTPCSAEVILDRLRNDDIPKPGPGNRMLSKLQGLFASYAHLWR
ncbi:capsular polysaccharide biosynthesis protein [Cochlodiniinecator piscidefendens]|uniref:capsular polysaccharide biosynthesis protein n=1 Tax=Cochlodiniinecator piscidefendens TaxID=2715756 RepID=UPI00140DC231|nr:capsular polysaccharide biosynthesis protein [Cochlodiniinecator piscidefendens]